jgi:hypothetical protein
MGMLGGLLRTKIAQLLDSPLKMQSQNGCKQKEHLCVEVSSTNLYRALCSLNVGKTSVSEIG